MHSPLVYFVSFAHVRGRQDRYGRVSSHKVFGLGFEGLKCLVDYLTVSKIKSIISKKKKRKSNKRKNVISFVSTIPSTFNRVFAPIPTVIQNGEEKKFKLDEFAKVCWLP